MFKNNRCSDKDRHAKSSISKVLNVAITFKIQGNTSWKRGDTSWKRFHKYSIRVPNVAGVLKHTIAYNSALPLPRSNYFKTYTMDWGQLSRAWIQSHIRQIAYQHIHHPSCTNRVAHFRSLFFFFFCRPSLKPSPRFPQKKILILGSQYHESTVSTIKKKTPCPKPRGKTCESVALGFPHWLFLGHQNNHITV